MLDPVPKMVTMYHHLLLLLLAASVSNAQEPVSVCTLLGGRCGLPSNEECVDGTWQYRIRCNPSYKTCCLPNEIPTEEPITTTTTPVTTTPPDVNSTITPGNGTEEECGAGPHLYSGGADAHIVGGVEAVPNSWPWMVSLEYGLKHHCGATLLNKDWVLTAAHCVTKTSAPFPKNYRVVVGKHARDDMKVTGYEQVIPVVLFIVHESYSTEIPGSPNDIALVRLAVPVDITPQVSPVCLPPTPNEDFTPKDKCYIIGFGDTKGLGKENVLNEVQVPITPNKVCDDKWRKGSGRINLIQPEHICAGNGIPGTCNGDSGGPLVCQRGSVWVQAGITSFGASGCKANNAPDVYTRVSVFNEWINDKIQDY